MSDAQIDARGRPSAASRARQRCSSPPADSTNTAPKLAVVVQEAAALFDVSAPPLLPLPPVCRLRAPLSRAGTPAHPMTASI